MASPSSTPPTPTAMAAGSVRSREAFRGRRDQVVFATKIGYDIYDEAAQSARRGQSELPEMRPRLHALRRRQMPRAARDRLHRRAPAPQRQDGARARRGDLGGVARAAGRGIDPGVGSGVRAGDRLAVRSRRAVRARARHQHDPDDLEHARAASGHGDDRGRAASTRRTAASTSA